MVIKKEKLNEIFFFLSYGIFLFFVILKSSFFGIYIYSYIKITMFLCVFLIFFKELFFVKVSLKEIIFLTICVGLSIILMLHLDNIFRVPFFFFLFGARKINFKKIAKFTLFESTLLLSIIIISANLGIIMNYKSVSGNRIREYLGFTYALIPQMYLFNITALFLYIKKQTRKSFFLTLIIIGVNYWMFQKTNSRLSFYFSVLLIVILLILEKFPNILKNRKIICIGLASSFFICFIFGIYFTMNYDSSNPVLYKLNTYLEHRLSMGKLSLSQYKINLFGYDVDYVGNGLDMYGNNTKGKYFYVDCLYLNMLEKNGIFFSTIVISLLTMSMFKAWKNKDYKILVILSMYALHGLVDDLQLGLQYNTFWFIIGEYIINNEYLKLKNKKMILKDVELRSESYGNV